MKNRIREIYTNRIKDEKRCERLIDYFERRWFCPSTPILHNSGKKQGLPISCFVNHVGDSMDQIRDAYNEAFEYARHGGGVGTFWGDVRERGAFVDKGEGWKTRGIIPFLKVQDSMSLAITQGSVRNGSTAVYLNVWHPEIENFIDLRRSTGADPNRRCLNLHHGVIIDDAFMEAVMQDKDYSLRGCKTGEEVKRVSARDIWQRILSTRIETGEPFLVFIDTVNRILPECFGDELKVHTSNLCSEILQPTSPDMPAVCCLGSLNLETYLEWEGQTEVIVEDCLTFLDSILNEFLEKTAHIEGFKKTRESVQKHRSVGLGTMGFHSFLQSMMVPFDSATAKAWNNKIFKSLHDAMKHFNAKIGNRFAFMSAIAPTATISNHFRCSPSIEPWISNIFTEKSDNGSEIRRNVVLDKLIRSRCVDPDKEWRKIQADKGRVGGCDFLEDREKDVFKTAFEIDQRWIIDLAADRAKYIDQGQSVNLFFNSNVDIKHLLQVHISAWKKGVKSLYYCRSYAENRPQVVGQEKYKECLACQ